MNDKKQIIARVFSQHKNLYKVKCKGKEGEISAEVAGKFHFEAVALSDYPAVGDFVVLDREDDAGGHAIIQSVLPRKSVFIRKAAGKSHDNQVVASNIDIVFLCMALNADFNLRRLERYLAVAWDSGAVPVVVLTKADLCENIDEKLAEVGEIAIGVDVLTTTSGEAEKLLKYVGEGKTAAFIGSSGVGKSTLINGLLGEAKMATKGLRNDDKGKHTTRTREMFELDASGGYVIDTPGIRGLGIENADLAKTFADLDEMAQFCKFRSCTHTSEPGCAVLQAIADGEISHQRLESFRKLEKEAKYSGLNSKQIEMAKINEIFKGKGEMKNARNFVKNHKK